MEKTLNIDKGRKQGNTAANQGMASVLQNTVGSWEETEMDAIHSLRGKIA